MHIFLNFLSTHFTRRKIGAARSYYLNHPVCTRILLYTRAYTRTLTSHVLVQQVYRILRGRLCDVGAHDKSVFTIIIIIIWYRWGFLFHFLSSHYTTSFTIIYRTHALARHLLWILSHTRARPLAFTTIIWQCIGITRSCAHTNTPIIIYIRVILCIIILLLRCWSVYETERKKKIREIKTNREQ